MSNWWRTKFNPIAELQRYVPQFSAGAHVTYDPNLRKGDFSMNRRQSTDGTLALTLMQVEEMLLELKERTKFHTANPPDLSRLKDIRYTIGPMKIATVFNPAKFRQREGFRLPVKVELVY